jgi:hypothetical protein
LSRFRLATRLFGGRSFNLPSRRTGTPCKLPNTERNPQETLLTSLGWNIWKKIKFNMSTDFASSSAFFFVTVTCKQWRRCSRDQTFKLSLLPIQSAAPLPLWFWYPEPAEWNKDGKRSMNVYRHVYKITWIIDYEPNKITRIRIIDRKLRHASPHLQPLLWLLAARPGYILAIMKNPWLEQPWKMWWG